MWSTIYDVASEGAPPSGLLLLGGGALLCVSIWFVYRFWFDRSQTGIRSQKAIGVCLMPGGMGVAVVVFAVHTHLLHDQLVTARVQERCVSNEGVLTGATGPDRENHMAYGFDVNGTHYVYNGVIAGFNQPLCKAGAPCTGDYVRICKYGRYILKIERRRGL